TLPPRLRLVKAPALASSGPGAWWSECHGGGHAKLSTLRHFFTRLTRPTQPHTSSRSCPQKVPNAAQASDGHIACATCLLAQLRAPLRSPDCISRLGQYSSECLWLLQRKRMGDFGRLEPIRQVERPMHLTLHPSCPENVQTDAERLAYARQMVRAEGDALHLVADRLGESFLKPFELIYRSPGRVGVTGTGKSADVGQKIAGTLNSTGTRSYVL